MQILKKVTRIFMSWIRNVFVIFIAILISIIIAEGLLRLFWDNPYKGTRSNKILEIRMQPPNVNTQKNRLWLDEQHPYVFFRTNNNSFIEPSNQHKKPDQTVMFMGASTTECSYVKEELRFPNHVSTLFKEAGHKINTINVGRSGNTLHDTINLFLNEMHRHKPDYVVVMHAANDIGIQKVDPTYSTRMAKDLTKTQVAKWLLQSASSHFSFFGLLRQSVTYWLNNRDLRNGVNSPAFAKDSSVDSTRFEQRLLIFVNISRSLGVEPILMTQPMSSSVKIEITPQWIDMGNQEKFNMIIRKVGLEENVLVIDLSSEMTLISDFQKNPKNYLYDGIHVTDKGSIEYAKIFYKTFSTFLKKSS